MRRQGYEFDKIDLADEEQYPEASSYWYTVPCTRTVLAVTRSVNTTLALIDALPDLLHDRRVQVVFTVMPRQRDANFDRWMRRLVHEAGVQEIKWEEATSRRFDLVVTASYEGYLSEVSGPALFLNHGTGVGKYLALPPDGRLPVSSDGTSTSTMVLSHPEQRPYYAAAQDPRARFLVAGDPWRDRLCASLHRRDHYRSALGIEDGARLIVVASTWGEYSLIATRPELPNKLLQDLPRDEYRLALVLHPNIWFGHSTWQVRAWMRQAVDHGLILVPPHDSWRGVLVAADAFIGDHGSMMLHAAALGLPLAFGCIPNDELIEGGPSAELEAHSPRLDPYSPLAAQIERMFSEHDPGHEEATIARVFAHPGESHLLIRREMYRLMGLEEPDEAPRVLAVDTPEVIREEVTAHRVETEVGADGTVSVARYPATKTPPPDNLISWWRPTIASRDSCRAPRSSWDANPIPRADGGPRPCGRTREPWSARPSTGPVSPCCAGAVGRPWWCDQNRIRCRSTGPWPCRRCSPGGSRVTARTRSRDA
jgi:hypothetical protein